MSRLLITFIILNNSLSLLSSNAFAEFDEEFEYVQRLELNAVGREQKLAAYEKLVRDYPLAPARSRAMIEIANLLGMTDETHGYTPSSAEAINWYRAAASAATVGSKDWFTAKWLLINKDSPETRLAHLADIEGQANGDSLILAKCELERFLLDLNEGRIESAEERMQTLNQWYSDPARVPTDSDAKFQLDHVIREPINLMLDWYARAPIPPNERQQKIESIRNLSPTDRVVFANSQHAIKMSNEIAKIAPLIPTVQELKKEETATARMFVYINVAVFVLIAIALIWQRLRGKESPRRSGH